MFIVNIFEYIQVFFFLSYRTLADFVKTIDCCFGTLVVTVKFVFEHTSSIKKGFVRPLIEFIVIMFKWFCFLFLKWHAGRSCQGN